MTRAPQDSAQNRIVHLKAGAHLMTMDAGLFCIFLAAGQNGSGPDGLPVVRISNSPGAVPGNLEIRTFDDEGFLKAGSDAALVRVARGPAQVLVTIYQAPDSQVPAPGIQVVQLAGAGSAPKSAPAPSSSPQDGATHVKGGQSGEVARKAEIAAHIQRRGDVLGRIGEWMGVAGSQNWIEGFGIAPESLVAPADVEYQAVLGKGWLSPWAEGGQYCGSRGMALPILGLRVRLKGQAAEKYDVSVTATFTDGTRVGPVTGEDAVEAGSLAPLEAFLVEIHSKGERDEVASSKKKAAPRKAVSVESRTDAKPAPVKAAPVKAALKPKAATGTRSRKKT